MWMWYDVLLMNALTSAIAHKIKDEITINHDLTLSLVIGLIAANIVVGYLYPDFIIALYDLLGFSATKEQGYQLIKGCGLWAIIYSAFKTWNSLGADLL